MNHLAIMRNPWMRLLIEGKKTVESRISQRRIIPWQKIKIGDWIYFRLSGDFAVTHKAKVKKVTYTLGKMIFERMREYKTEIGIDEEYIKSKSKCNYLTLIWLEPIIPLEEKVFPFIQKGQKAWFVNIKVINNE